MKYLIFLCPLFFVFAIISDNVYAEEKSVAEEIGNVSGRIVWSFTEGLFALESLADQGIEKIENIEYGIRDGYYDFEYDLRKGYQQDE